MRDCRLYEKEEELLLDGGGGKKGKKQKKIVYRYDWLVDEARKGDDDGVQTLQDRIIEFVIYKKNMGLGAINISVMLITRRIACNFSNRR